MDLNTQTTLKTLAEAYLEGTLTEAQRHALEEELARTPSARLLFLSYLETHAGLAWEIRNPSRPFSSEASEAKSQTITHFPLRWFAAAAAVIALSIGWWLSRPLSPTLQDQSLARVLHSLHAQWADGREIYASEAIERGGHHLRSGLLEMETSSGVHLLLEGPADIEWLEPTRIRLLAGSIVVRMPKGSSGFVIETPRLKVTDLGTEFGVGITSDGETRVQVFSGRVFTELSGSDSGRELHSGDTLVYSREGNISEPDYSEDRFIRRFPKPKAGTQSGGAIYNQSTQEALNVTRAPSRITIDGDLSEWRTERGFRSACVPPYASTYFVEGMMMYDSQNLYIAAHIGDPDPMLNAGREGMEFAGGSVIVRLCTDRTLGWPIHGTTENARSKNPSRPPMPDSLSEKVNSMVLWFDAKTLQPRLTLTHSFDFRRPTNPLEGWKGAFRKDANGHGYTLEYAIPWRLLQCAEDPPQPSDTLAALWTVHWSDAEGRVCRGQLVDISNQNPQKDLQLPKKIDPAAFFQFGPLWGKAVFVPEEP